MVPFLSKDYTAIKRAVLDRMQNRDYYSGVIEGTTVEGVRYRFACTIIRFTKEQRLVPVWWDMLTFGENGELLLNDFSFSEIKWF